MPIGGADGIGFDEAVPSDGEAAGLGDDRIRSLKTSLRQGIGSEHNWPSAGGNAVGYHLYGSARPYYGLQSAVSSSGTDGRLFMASDSSRLFGVGSGGTTYLGGPAVISAGSFPGSLPQRAIWQEEWGIGATGSGASLTITVPNSGFSGAPYVQVSQVAPTVDGGLVNLLVSNVGATSFIVTAAQGAVYSSGITFFWRSVGTRTL